MIVGGGLFLIVGLIAENYALIFGSSLIIFIGVLCEK